MIRRLRLYASGCLLLLGFVAACGPTATETDSMLIAVNVRDTSATVTVPETYSDASLTDALANGAVGGTTLELGPYGYRLIKVGE